ncbi:MAG: lipase family protein [Hyphomicrobiales bacterium]
MAATIFAAMGLAGCASSAANQQLDILGSRVNETVVDFADIETYAKRAKAAYGTEAQIRAAYPRTVRIATPGKDQVRYFVERDDAAKTQTISVRGTANRRNLSEDEKAKLVVDRHAGIPVHKGFDDVAAVVYADLAPNLKKGYTTYVTGHSLGGAVAALVAIYAMEDGHQVKRVVTFGQPRFTTAVGVAKLGNLPLTRVVDENDIIPMVPPASMGDKVYGPYEHVGPEIILLEGPRYVYLPSHDATRLSLGEFWRTEGFADLPDHKMDTYLRRIADKRKGAIAVSYDDREKYVVHKPKDARQRSEQ